MSFSSQAESTGDRMARVLADPPLPVLTPKFDPTHRPSTSSSSSTTSSSRFVTSSYSKLVVPNTKRFMSSPAASPRIHRTSPQPHPSIYPHHQNDASALPSAVVSTINQQSARFHLPPLSNQRHPQPISSR